MSVRVVYRNSLIYYALMPGLWISAALIHLGFGSVYVVYIIVKMSVIIGAHSSVPWDAPLLRNRYTRPLMWVVARVISTPATHAAHHGRHQTDGVTHYKGNFGNLLFVWDILFRTAKITNTRPHEFGLEDVEPATWADELLWPGLSSVANDGERAQAPSPRVDG
jgi:sterol desaturase/sphingolipid hydroxylase (fatty acid hydroxylase superfamily)